MIGETAIERAEAYVARIERVVGRLRDLHGLSESEALFFIEQLGDMAVDGAVDCASRGTSRTER